MEWKIGYTRYSLDTTKKDVDIFLTMRLVLVEISPSRVDILSAVGKFTMCVVSFILIIETEESKLVAAILNEVIGNITCFGTVHCRIDYDG